MPTYPLELLAEHPNLNEPVLRVKHADLREFSPESAYRRCCPVCDDGVLLVARDSKTFELLAEDRCVSCGQHVLYEDIDQLR